MPISKRIRFETFRRDGHRCRYCGATAEEVKVTVDHVVPVALGGTDDPTNLVAACTDCNAGKTSIAPGAPLVDDVAADAARWAKAMAIAAELQRKADTRLAAYSDDFDAVWKIWTYTEPDGTKEYVPRPNDWRTTIERLVTAGLDHVDFEYLVRVAMESDAVLDNKWRYFCGCGWRRLTDRQETARQILEQEDN